MPTGSGNDPSGCRELALQKLTRVFGEHRGDELLHETLAEIQLATLETPGDLLRFGRALERRGGFEAAVGAMLSVQATLKGAKG